jgi:hypothetical protein
MVETTARDGQDAPVTDDIYQVIFNVAEALELPVVLLAVAALIAVIYETGAFVVERLRRGRRSFPALASAADQAHREIGAGDRPAAAKTLAAVAWSPAMKETLDAFATEAGTPGAEPRGAQRRAHVGTLIPLSPALEGLAKGDVDALADNLRLAFSITVLGLLVGAAAFALSLARDRIYGQDHSDLEYVAAVLTGPPADPGAAPELDVETAR